MRRTEILDGALAVLADQGMRGLTHRAVDAAAGLPAGSTSYYFRSRAALLEACVADLVAQDHAELDLMTPLVTASDWRVLADALGDVLYRWISTDRRRHVARYELSMEALR